MCKPHIHLRRKNKDKILKQQKNNIPIWKNDFLEIFL